MPSRTIDKPTYTRLVEAFRTYGENWYRVSKETGLSRGMVRRAYAAGWQNTHPWARPIAAVIQEDGLALRAALADEQDDLESLTLAEETVEQRRRRARVERESTKLRVRAERFEPASPAEALEKMQAETKAALEKEAAEQEARRAEVEAHARREREELVRRRSEAETAQEAEREKARQQAVEARTQEAQLVRLSRGAAIGTLGGTMRLMPALAKLADQLRAAVDAGQIPVDRAASTINTIARTVREATVAAQVVIELERLHVGAPQAIIGVMQHEVALDEAALAVEEFQAAIDRSRQLGIVQPTTISVGPKKGAT
jgi:hypothetical protein